MVGLLSASLTVSLGIKAALLGPWTIWWSHKCGGKQPWRLAHNEVCFLGQDWGDEKTREPESELEKVISETFSLYVPVCFICKWDSVLFWYCCPHPRGQGEDGNINGWKSTPKVRSPTDMSLIWQFHPVHQLTGHRHHWQACNVQSLGLILPRSGGQRPRPASGLLY